MLENVLHDLRYGLRTLAKSPAFAIVAVVSLGLGIGVNTTIFSLVNAVLLRPMPVADPDRVAHVYTGREEFKYLTVSYPDYLDFRDQNDVFSGMVAHSMMRVSLAYEGRSEAVVGEVVSGNYFDVLGVKTVLGRGFEPEEDRTPGTHPVVVLGHGFWTRRFGRDAGIVGKVLSLSGLSYTVVGVAPASFTGTIPGLAPEIWIPLAMESKLSVFGVQDVTTSPGATRLERRGDRFLFVKGRLKPGVTVASAQANLDTLMARLAEAYPDTNRKRNVSVVAARGVRIHPLVDSMLTPAAGVLMGVVGVVLLIACANVANMLLARASARQREIAIRLAMGATRARLVRQLLTEGLLLSMGGAIVGLLLANWTVGVLLAFRPPLGIPLSLNASLDARVFLFTMGVAFLTGAVFGLAPALSASRPELVPALKDESFRVAARRRVSFRDLLVVAQIAGSLVLLVGAGLLVRSLFVARSIELGFRPGGLAIIDINLKLQGYTPEHGKIFYRTLLERVRALPEVESASLASRLPLSTDINKEGIFIDGRPAAPGDDGIPLDATYVGTDYFRALGVPLVEGREFTDEDREGSPGVVIVNEVMARTYWPGESALGKRIHTESPGAPSFEIVGVSANYKVQSVGEAPLPYLHFARGQNYFATAHLVARGHGDAASLVATLRREILALDPNLALGSQLTMDEQIATSLFPVRMGAVLLAIFGALALVLAAVGLYGVISYSVSRRTREMGIRMAIGAPSRSVLTLVVREGMCLAAAGVVLGLTGAAAVSRVLSGVLYGVGAVDPLAFGGAAVVLLGVAFIANVIPARRAARVDPMTALRVQ